MPKCRNCDANVPPYLVIDGKTHNLQHRKFCLTCSPFKSHNTRTDLSISKEKKVQILKSATCIVCQKTYEYAKNKGGTSTQCFSCMTKKRRIKIKQQCLEYKGNKCIHCGYDRCPAALDFHHVDPSKKSFNISIAYIRAWHHIQNELDKCILLCANCHRELEAGMGRAGADPA